MDWSVVRVSIPKQGSGFESLRNLRRLHSRCVPCTPFFDALDRRILLDALILWSGAEMLPMALRFAKTGSNAATLQTVQLFALPNGLY